MKALFCQSNCLKRFHELIDVRTAKLGSTSMEETKHPTEGAEDRDVPQIVSNITILDQHSAIIFMIVNYQCMFISYPTHKSSTSHLY